MLEFFRIGKFVKTRGLKGDLKVYSHTDDINRFKELEYVYIGKDKETKYEVEKASVGAKGMAFIKLKGYNTIEDVQKFVNKEIFIAREDAYELDEDEMFVVDMLGMDVRLEDGTSIGTLKEVLSYSANDVYVVKSPEGKEYLIPATYEVVPEINAEENYMIVVPIPGLLD